MPWHRTSPRRHGIALTRRSSRSTGQVLLAIPALDVHVAAAFTAHRSRAGRTGGHGASGASRGIMGHGVGRDGAAHVRHGLLMAEFRAGFWRWNSEARG